MKKFLYSTIIACLALAGLTSCDPQESDDHSLSGSIIPQEALSLGVEQIDEARQVTFVFTNNSQELADVKYYISTNGSKILEFPVGASTEVVVKSNRLVEATLYAFSGQDQKNVLWSKDVDWFSTETDNQWLGFTEGTNLLENWNPEVTNWFSPGDWSGGLNPGVDGTLNTGITLVVPEGVGGDQWQAQLHLNAGEGSPTLSAAKSYDFSIVIESTADSEGDGVTIKPQKSGDDGTFFSEARHPIKKGLNVISLANCAGFDGNFKVALDFAGVPVGTAITVRRAFLTEHNAANASSDTWAFNYKDDANLMQAATLNPEYWFSPSDWSGGLNPETDGNQELLEVIVPEGTGADQWQGQIHLKSDAVIKEGKNYDFSVVLLADHDIAGVTVKPQKDGDDGTFFMEGRYDLTANVAKSVVLTAQPGFNGTFQLCLDVAGAPAGTKVKILGIYIGESK